MKAKTEPRLIDHTNRLAEGGLIDRQRALTFRFDGAELAGYAGDTLAAALLAAGRRLVGRSFKYHRPRGVLTAGSEEPNALVELRSGARREPNTRATIIELFEGLQARSQNRFPSLSCDVGAINSLLAPFFTAGFYYKTFMWPASFWEKVYEPLIRRAAGLGRASTQPDPDTYEKVHAFCDVLVIGAGPAGLAAALSAGRAGARVILCDEDFLPGGRLNGDRREIDGIRGSEWAQRTVQELLSLPDVTLMTRTTVFGVYDHGTYGAIERVADHLPTPQAHQPRQRFWKIVSRRAVLAAGATERPLVFGGNDRPGVMLASAVRTYLNRFAVASGRHAAVFTTTDDGWSTAFDLARAGVQVNAIIDARDRVSPALRARAMRLQLHVITDSHVFATDGGRELSAVRIRDRGGRELRIHADLLAVSGGWNPNLGLTTHLGARPAWSDTLAAFLPNGDVPGMTVVGACRGSFSLAASLREGFAAGAEAARALGYRSVDIAEISCGDEATSVSALWEVPASRGPAFVDFQNDVTREDIALAVREGYRSVEHLKRYTTLGMGTDQGKLSNTIGHAILAQQTGRTISATGTSVVRPPHTPVAIAAFAGRYRGKHFRPTRLPPAHEWARANGAAFIDAGQWLRARWFARPGEKDWRETVAREVTTVRNSVGVCDVSTLGKIDVQGFDAAAFLDRLYINRISSLPVGKVRYGVMLREDGFVLDDGTVARLGPEHFLVSTTTANAARVMQHLEHARQVLWPQLDVQLASVTDQWAQYAIAGPNARNLLERLPDLSVDVCNEAFPYLACTTLQWHGSMARLFRVSFSGELGYELAVPARNGEATIRALIAAGQGLGVAPYGTEALGTLRIEKGHLGGGELNGTTTAADLGLSRMFSEVKCCIGQVLARRPALTDPGRMTLVGLRSVSRKTRLNAGAHLLRIGEPPSHENDQGYITSATHSPTLGCSIALGLLAFGPRRTGECLRAYDPLRGADVEVEVVSPVFHDAQGSRLRA